MERTGAGDFVSPPASRRRRLKKTLIIGCGVAGFSAARKLKTLAPDAQVSIVDAEGRGLYTKIRLPEYIAGKLPGEKLVLNSPESIEKLGVRHLKGVSASALDVAKRTVSLSDGSVEEYDELVLACGSSAANPCLKACGNTPVFTLRTLVDADAMIKAAEGAKSATVVGGGLLGLELAWALKSRGLKVDVVECLPRLLPKQFDEIESELLRRKLVEMGFSFHLGVRLDCVSEEGGAKTLKLHDGTLVKTDMVAVSAGITPRLDLAKAAGLECGFGVKVDASLRSSAEGVYAIGDCAELAGRVWGLWAAAKDQGEGLAAILTGAASSFESPVYDPIPKVSGIQIKELRAEAAALRAEKEGARG
jgi:nitrite reductase (NADH) large subunit